MRTSSRCAAGALGAGSRQHSRWQHALGRS